MRPILAAACLALACPALVACAGVDERPDDTVSVQYDPNRFDASALQRAATAQCRAKGYARAEPLNDQPNTEAVRWAYLTYGCYAR